MSIPIASDQLQPPDLPSHYIQRERLNALFSHPQAKIILVEAPGGSGKSVAVADFARTLSTPLVWVPLARLEQHEALSFISNLIRALQIPFPEFGYALLSLIEEGAQHEALPENKDALVETALPAFITIIRELPFPLWIILEDYHLLSSCQEIWRVLLYLVHHTPKTVRFILTARPPLEWEERVRWEAQEFLVTISMRQLALTSQESHTLAKEMGVPLSISQLEEVQTVIHGWPLLTYLFYRNARGLPGSNVEQDIAETLALLSRPGQPIYEYLEREFLAKEVPAVADFLCRTSILKVLDAEVCRFLLDAKETDVILEQLYESPYLTPLWEGENLQFVHYHDIVREFLQRALERNYSLRERQADCATLFL